MENVKYIRDPLYGNIKVEGVALELIETPEMQRLLRIKQLGYTYLVYPGANHTRFEHSLGTFYVEKKMCDALGVDEEVACIAALLHDVGHGPFSHTLEYLLNLMWGKDHMAITREMILGKRTLQDCEHGTSIREVLERYGVSADEVVDVLGGKRGHISEMVHGHLDADQIDYLMRDAYYTGVAYGVIDVDRIIQTMKVHEGMVVFEKKGVSSLESMLVARALMYSAVYLHKTVRIAELMLSRAVERAPPFDFSQMTDCELTETLKGMGDYQKDMVLRLKYRNLFKRAFSRTREELRQEKRELSVKRETVKETEDEIAKRAGIPEGYVIVDIPGKDILLSEPRIRRMDVGVEGNGEIIPLSRFTPLANALQQREITEWAVMVCCPEKHRAEVARQTERVLFR